MTVIAGESDWREWGGQIRRTYRDETIYFTGFDDDVLRERVHLFDILWTKLDEFPIPDDRSIIPVKVACAGKAAIATYLYCIHPSSYGDIADTLDVTKSTIKQYLTDVKAGRRL